MAKKTKPDEAPEQNEVTVLAEEATTLAPTIVETVETSVPAAVDTSLERPVPKGHVVVAELDKDGNEIPGSEFTVLESGFIKRYSDPKQFILKKKPL